VRGGTSSSDAPPPPIALPAASVQSAQSVGRSCDEKPRIGYHLWFS
jgi:hypothetical protein